MKVILISYAGFGPVIRITLTEAQVIKEQETAQDYERLLVEQCREMLSKALSLKDNERGFLDLLLEKE